MRFVDEYRDPDLARALLADLLRVPLEQRVTFMEVCGSHTMAVSRSGLRELLPETIHLVSGPGCPVCVTATSMIDRAIRVTGLPTVTLATFGDLLRVPGSASTLERERARGADVRVVYSPTDALETARREPTREVVFLGVGFETTAPTVAATILEAETARLENFSVLCDHKVMPPAMQALMEAPDVTVRGFLCPGHVSTIIGSDAFGFLARDHHASCVVAGFEPLDILQALLHLARQAADGAARVENLYGRVVSARGNTAAQAVMEKAFVPCDAAWRGFGVLPRSGLAITPSLAHLDASVRFPMDIPEGTDDPACRCPDVLRGVLTPPECRLFGRSCTPSDPRGACMVSSEGTCAAYYRYGRGGQPWSART